jgi:hypothetical protein
VLFDKRLLPYLSDDELNGFLSDADRAAIAGVLPWTRSLRDGQAWFRGRRQDLPALCRAHQEDLVLKKGDGYGGGQVRIGRDMSATDWEAAVQAGLAEGTWIVQELVVPRSGRMPYLRGGELVWADVTAMTCPYVIEGRIRGVASRTSVPDGSRVLVGAGAEGSHAGISTAFVVADGSAAGS